MLTNGSHQGDNSESGTYGRTDKSILAHEVPFFKPYVVYFVAKVGLIGIKLDSTYIVDNLSQETCPAVNHFLLL